MLEIKKIVDSKKEKPKPYDPTAKKKDPEESTQDVQALKNMQFQLK